MGCRSSKVGGATEVLPQLGSTPVDLHVSKLKKLIRKNPELSDIVTKFIKSLLPVIEKRLADLICTLDLARFYVKSFRTAVRNLEKEKKCSNNKNGYYIHIQNATRNMRANNKKNAYRQSLEKLRKIGRLDNSFNLLNIHEMRSAQNELETTINQLRKLENTIDETLRSIKRWRRAWNVAFTTVSLGVLICSVVLAAVVAPPVGIAAVPTGVAAVKAVEQWINSVWKAREMALKEEQGLVGTACDVLRPAIDEFVRISFTARKLRNYYAVLKEQAQLVLHQDGDGPEMVSMEKTIEIESEINQLKSASKKLALHLRGLEHRFPELYAEL